MYRQKVAFRCVCVNLMFQEVFCFLYMCIYVCMHACVLQQVSQQDINSAALQKAPVTPDKKVTI